MGEAFVRVRPDASGFGREADLQVTRQMRQVEASVGRANREVSRFGRGALVGTGALGGLGRAAAFASTSFIGGAGLVFALKSTVAAAEDAQVAQTQLRNALRSQGVSFKENRRAIEDRTQAISQMAGIDDELVSKVFTGFIRQNKNVSLSLRESAIAANVARGRNIEYESAAKLVQRAALGSAGALRRVGIAAKDGASSIELLDLLQKRFAGSAKTYGDTASGAQERFGVALENAQEIIGTALLPTITRLLTKGTEWLNDTDNQKRIQDDVNEALKVTEAVLGGVKDALDQTLAVLGPVVDAFGGLKDVVEAALVGGIALKAARAASAIGRIGLAEKALTGVMVAESAKQSAALGRTIPVRGRGGGLTAAGAILAFLGFKAVFPQGVTDIGGTIDPNVFGANGSPFPKGSPNDLIYQRNTGRQRLSGALNTNVSGTSASSLGFPSKVKGASFVGRPLTLLERLQAAVDAAGLTPGTADDVAALRAQRAQFQRSLDFAQKQIRDEVGNTKVFADDASTLSGQIQSIESQLSGIAAENASKAEAAARALKAAAAAAKRAAAKRAAARLELIEATIPNTPSGTANAPGAFGRAQALAGQFISAAFGRGGRATVDLSAARASFGQAAAIARLNTQIAEQTVKHEDALIPYIQRENTALARQLSLLKKASGTLVEKRQVELEIAQNKKRIRDIKKQERSDAFSAQDLFTLGAGQFAALGSNVAPLTGILSPQEAGGATISAAKALSVHQHFYGEQPNPAQALAQAANAARALR